MNEIIREKDGYISATKLCQKSGKRVTRWLHLSQTKNLIEICSKYINLSEDKLIEIYKGGSKYTQSLVDQGYYKDDEVSIYIP